MLKFSLWATNSCEYTCMHTCTCMHVHYIIQKSQSTQKSHVAMHIPNPHLIYIFLFFYSSYFTINIWPTMNLLPNTNSSYCAQTNVFVTLDCHCTQLFQTGHAFPYGHIYHTEEHCCCDEMPLKYWVIERHFINALTHSKIIFLSNTTSPLATILIKNLEGSN